MDKTQIISEIEWLFTDEYTPEVLNGISTNRIFESIRKLDKIPLKKTDIAFSDDTWDLTNSVLKRVPQRRSIYKFEEISADFKDEAKFFTLLLLWQGNNKIQSIFKKLSEIKSFFRYLTTNNISSLNYVSLQTIKSFIEQNNHLSPGTIESYKSSISSLFEFHSQNFTPLEIDPIYKYLNDYDSNACLAQREANKWDTIPDDYFNRLISCLIRVMNDEDSPTDERGIAAEVMLMSQTGLRQGELTDCTVNSVHNIPIFNGTKTAYYLKYYTTKSVRGDLGKREVYTMINELALKAYTVLTSIYEERRRAIKTDLLFVPLKVKTLPVRENVIGRMLAAFLLKHGKEVGCINVAEKYPELRTQSIGTLIVRQETTQEVLSKYTATDILSIPRSHQFRVYLCNKLYEQGVPLLFIQQHMNHLSREMSAYYIRPKKDVKKEQEYAESVMKMIVTNSTTILGDTKDELIKQINDFIAESKLNVEKDLNTIVSKLVKKMPVRAKAGGICIKSGPIRDCRKNDISDEIFCSYGICPNNFHVYYMVDISYNKYLTVLETIKFNKAHNFPKAVEKETNKLKWLIEKYLMPEVEELKKEISVKGADKIKELHPQITFHVDNVDSIYEEIIEWTK